MKNPAKHQKKFYEERFASAGDSPQGVYWNDEETQFLRFERLINAFTPFKGAPSFHDVGCGTAELHRFLTEKNIHHEYSGSELVKEMVECIQKKDSTLKVFNRDILDAPREESYDIVVMSGVFNLRMDFPKEDWIEYVENTLTKTFSMSQVGISFNMLTGFSDFEDPDLAYFEPREIFNFCHDNLSRFIQLDHAYPLYEFTVSVFQPQYLREVYNHGNFKKYFK